MEELGSKPLSEAMAGQGGAEPELDPIVWHPYAQPASFRSPVGLEVKLGSLVLLLFVTLVCGFLPLWVFHRPGTITSSSGKDTLAVHPSLTGPAVCSFTYSFFFSGDYKVRLN